MILVGDIGGTKTDLALYEMEGEKLILRKFSAYHSKDHAGLLDVVRLFLNQDNLNKIHDDMSQADVRSIMGAPSESRDEPIPIVGGTQTTYIYRNDKSEVTIVFKNDQEQSKQGTFAQ